LLAIEDILDILPAWRVREIKVPDILDLVDPLISFPKDKGTNRIAFEDAVKETSRLPNFSNEMPLKLRNLYDALPYFRNQVIIGFGIWLGLMVHLRSLALILKQGFTIT